MAAAPALARAYRERLKDKWGIVDVDDCANGARYLVGKGEVDGDRLMITGGSAGGYTTLCALTFRDTFNAGASHYGVSDAEALAKETHKFESRYLDGLMGPYPARRDIYLDRSPINFTDRLSCPTIFFRVSRTKWCRPIRRKRWLRRSGRKGFRLRTCRLRASNTAFVRRRTSNARWMASSIFIRGCLGLNLQSRSSRLRLIIFERLGSQESEFGVRIQVRIWSQN